MKPCLQTARRYVEALTGDADTPMNVRLFHDDRTQHRPAAKRYGPIKDLWAEILAFQGQGYGAFVVVNEGGNTDQKITGVRAVFVDADGIPFPNDWHLQPDFIIQRDATHWHAYWLTVGVPVVQFREIQKRLAAHYGTDTAVCNPSRVMRLPGTLHQKDASE